jgi:hypothetical protein
MCKSSRLIICYVLTIISHFKEEARKEMMKPTKDEDLEEETKPKHLFKCFNDDNEQLTFEDMVLLSVKHDRLEFDTLALERIIFAKGILEEVWATDVERAFKAKQGI